MRRSRSYTRPRVIGGTGGGGGGEALEDIQAGIETLLAPTVTAIDSSVSPTITTKVDTFVDSALNYVATAPTVFTGSPSVPVLSVGTTSRVVGCTALGEPTSGTFAVGDVVVSQAGEKFVCTVAGTPGTWKRLAPWRYTYTAPSSAASVTITDIPSTFETLFLRYNIRSTVASASDIAYVRVNSDASAEYAWEYWYVNNTALGSNNHYAPETKAGLGYVPGATQSSWLFGGGTAAFHNWNRSKGYEGVRFDTVLSLSQVASYSYLERINGVYRGSGPFTSLYFYAGSGSIEAGSTFTLEGW